MQNVSHKGNWTLAPGAFQSLLSWLDEGKDSAGQSYLEMRRRLVAYFDRKNCPEPDELADETFNRVTRRLEQEEALGSEAPARYCYIVARYVFMEYLRSARVNEVALDVVTIGNAVSSFTPNELEYERSNRERSLSCLDQCMTKLEPSNRELIIGYYFGVRRTKIENRRTLAARLGLSVNALAIRACRIRNRLEVCVESCISAR